jgi:Protein of unknown function (DUF3764).
MEMKFLTTFKISKGFDRWLKLVNELQPYMDKYEYKLIFACTNDEESRVWDMGEANNADLVTDFLNDQEVITMRKEAGVDFESSEVLSLISKHKIW